MFYQGINVPAVQAFENQMNLEETKQEQAADVNIIDTNCWGFKADIRPYLCSGSHGRVFLVIGASLF